MTVSPYTLSKILLTVWVPPGSQHAFVVRRYMTHTAISKMRSA